MEEICGMPKRKSKHYDPLNYARGDVQSHIYQKVKSASGCQRKRTPKKSKTDLIYEKLQELDENAEVLDLVLPFRSLGKNSSLTNINDLFKINDYLPSPLTHKQAKTLQLNEGTAIIMTKQIQQMKSSMEKLQKAIQKSCSQKLTQDIDFIVGNVGTVIKKSDEMKDTSGRSVLS